jgi:hypothetical protein
VNFLVCGSMPDMTRGLGGCSYPPLEIVRARWCAVALSCVRTRA